MLNIRRAEPSDAGVIARHRVLMFRDMGWLAADGVAGMLAATEPLLADELRQGWYLGWLAQDHEGVVVGGGGMVVHRILPFPGLPGGGREATIFNMYVEAQARRRGIARQLMDEMVAWCQQGGIWRVVLRASPDGRALYEDLGFRPTNHLQLDL